MATKLLYLEDFDVVTCKATVVAVNKTEDGRTDVELDQTCFYARGGGQDWDMGSIDEFNVEEVRLDEAGVAHHIGGGVAPMVGAEVNCQVDTERRQRHTRLHSGAHVIDMAISKIQPEWVPLKGAHYPHMSFVEYEGVADEPVTLQETIQAAVDQLLKQDITNTIRFADRAELEKLCRHVPEYLPTNKPTRVVLYGDFGVPCGGTHVRKVSDIGKLEVTRVKTKKGVTKVSYRIEGVN